MCVRNQACAAVDRSNGAFAAAVEPLDAPPAGNLLGAETLLMLAVYLLGLNADFEVKDR